MGILGTIGRIGLGVATGGASELVLNKGIRNKIFGDGKDPGLFGTANYQADPFSLNTGVAEMDRRDYHRDQIHNGQYFYGQRTAPKATINTPDEFRGGQMSLAQALQRQASGQGPSLAQAQLQQATDRNMSQAMALAASQRGNGANAALKGVADQRAGISQQMAADSGMLRLQEQQQAQGMLAGVLNQGRGQDLSLATNQAQMNLQSALATQSNNDAMVRYYTQAGMSLDQAQMEARMQMEHMRMQQWAASQGIQMDAYNTAGANRTGLLNSIGQVAGIGAGGKGG